MVHLTLPHRISGHLHHHPKQNGTNSTEDNAKPRAPQPARQVSTSTVADLKPLTLKINVLRGRNLAPKDRSGTSDPYLVVNVGTSKQSTPSISKTLNPEWNTCFEMPLSEVPLVECVCWDKDRFKKDYMGEFDIAAEDIFANGKLQQEPKWYTLRSKRKSNKKSAVSGEVQMQFMLMDTYNPSATEEQTYRKFKSMIAADAEDDILMLSRSSTLESQPDEQEVGDEDHYQDQDTSDETDATTVSAKSAKTAKKRRLARLRRKSIAVRSYDFMGKDSDVSGIIFMEIQRISDLPPELNVMRTSFDMDPFVITSLGRKVLRTRVIRHNLNPVYNEKMVFQVMRHEMSYSFGFSVVDRDSFSGNDFVASANFPVQRLIAAAPEEDPDTGLYKLHDPPEYSPPVKESKPRFRLPLSRSSSSTSITKLGRPGLKSDASQLSLLDGQMTPVTPTASQNDGQVTPLAPTSNPIDSNALQHIKSGLEPSNHEEDPDMLPYEIPLELKNRERWEAKHSPCLYIKAKFLPYRALRQQFWRAMLKQYDIDESRRVSKIELATMLDTLGSTLRASTIDGFFDRFAEENEQSDNFDLTFDQAVTCLEDQLEKIVQQKSLGERLRGLVKQSQTSTVDSREYSIKNSPRREGAYYPSANEKADQKAVPAIEIDSLDAAGEDGSYLDEHDLGDDEGDEHVIEIRECPICHQPLKHRTDADVITHIATCASSDWRQVNNLVMGGFVTASQAQRKWYSKVMTKVSYGNYRLGANSANILVQDRLTGQINEERMSVYVRLGIRLMYKALGSREMEKKRIRKMLKSLSVKQGKKFDDPVSARQIEGFINFHRLDMSEVLLLTEQFKSFNEFFYRQLKSSARPCSAPDNPNIIVSPADCRSVVFNTMDDATRIWVKGREYNVERLFGEAYPLDAKRYKGGALGIFRLAPQDYHRFHVPVDGVIGTPKLIEGEYYTVNPMAIRSALDVYGDNIRTVIPIDSVAHGRVMYICIGAMMVGSTVITRKAGERVKRAEELGYFKFGGSTVLLLFEPGAMVFDDDLIENSNGALETLVRVGMSIGHHPDSGAYTPDMRKADANITMEDRQEAKRRIEGSFAPDPH